MIFPLPQLPRWFRDIVPLIVWMGLIFLLSSQSVLVQIHSKVGEKFFYKGSHMITYAILTWLWWRALTSQRRVTWSILLAAFTLTVLYGISDEIHQLFVPGRHSQVADVLFDAGGALTMILIIRRVRWLRLFPETFSLSSARREEKSAI